MKKLAHLLYENRLLPSLRITGATTLITVAALMSEAHADSNHPHHHETTASARGESTYTIAADLAQSPLSVTRFRSLLDVVEDWAETNPEAARRFADELELHTSLRRKLNDALARGWARHDVSAAWAYSHSLAQSDNESTTEQAWAKSIAEQGHQTLPLVATVADQLSLAAWFAACDRAIALRKPAFVRGLVDLAPPGEKGDELIAHAIDGLFSLQRLQTARWLEAREKNGRTRLGVARFGRRMAASDIPAALHWISSTFEPEIADWGIMIVTNTVLRNEDGPAKIAQWISSADDKQEAMRRQDVVGQSISMRMAARDEPELWGELTERFLKAADQLHPLSDIAARIDQIIEANTGSPLPSAVTSEADPLQRSLQIDRFTAKLSDEGLRETALEIARAAKDPTHQADTEQLFLNYALRNPQDSLDLVAANEDDEGAFLAALRGIGRAIARSDAATGKSSAAKLNFDRFEEWALYPFYNAYAEELLIQRNEAAWPLLQKSQFGSELVSIFVDKLVAQGRFDAAWEASSNADAPDRDDIRLFLIVQAAVYDPDWSRRKAAEIAEKSPDRRSSIASAIVQGGFAFDQSIAWIESLQPARYDADWLSEIAFYSPGTPIDSFVATVKRWGFEGETRDQLYADKLRSYAGTRSPAAALEQLKLIEDVDTRIETTAEIFQLWTQRDPLAAWTALARFDGLPAADANALLRSLVENWAENQEHDHSSHGHGDTDHDGHSDHEEHAHESHEHEPHHEDSHDHSHHGHHH